MLDFSDIDNALSIHLLCIPSTVENSGERGPATVLACHWAFSTAGELNRDLLGQTEGSHL